jgi:hypothetical protein
MTGAGLPTRNRATPVRVSPRSPDEIEFGVVTDIETGPDGHLYVVSLSDGAIYEIARR